MARRGVASPAGPTACVTGEAGDGSGAGFLSAPRRTPTADAGTGRSLQHDSGSRYDAAVMQPFTDLKVWQRSHALALEVYPLTRRLPPDEAAPVDPGAPHSVLLRAVCRRPGARPCLQVGAIPHRRARQAAG